MSRNTVLLFALLLVGVMPAAGVTYPLGPSASGVIDVTDLPANLLSEGLSNLDNSGASDNQANLQALVNRFRYQADDNPNLEVRILYFPNGTYRLDGGITGVTKTPGGGGILLQGQSRENTILQLSNSASGFGNASSPQKLISFFDSTWTNNAFYNGIEDLTIDTGTGNPGAIALGFYSNNTGYVRNVRLRTGGNGSAPGAVGLLTNESTSSSSPSGVGWIKGLEVRGFDIGIHTGAAAQQGYGFEDITLIGQGVSGIQVNQQPTQFRRITSTNIVPAITVHGISSHVVVLDSVFNGGSSSNAAIRRTDGHVFVRDCIQSGYRAIIDDDGTDVTTDLSDAEYLSSNSQVVKQWASTPSETLDIPIAETPEVPWDNDAADWYIVDPTIQVDDTAALEAAMNSGASTICILPADDPLRLSSTVTIGPNVKRIIGQWNDIQPIGYLFHSDPGEPLLKLSGSNHSAVVIEKFRGPFIDQRRAYLTHHDSTADLILRDIFYGTGPLYRNTPGKGGRLFIEDVHLLPGTHPDDLENQQMGIVIDHQEAYMRMINPEFFLPGILNNGGTVWIMGFKVGESAGPVVESINNATTEILGGVMNMTEDTEPVAVSANSAILEIDHSNVSAVLIERFEGVGSSGGLGWGKNVYAAIETRGDETRSLLNETSSGVPRRPGQLGAMFALYVGYQFGVTIEASVAAARESDGTVNAFTVLRGDNDTSSAVTVSYSVGGTAQAGTHYVGLSGQATIPAGASSVDIPVTLLDNEQDDVSLTVELTLLDGTGYQLGQTVQASLSIIDNDFVSAPGADAVLTDNTSSVVTVTLNNPTNAPVTVAVNAPSGDNYEYRTSDDQGGPEFEWIEISGTGSKILDNADDASSTGRPIGFSFPYYGNDYSTVNINANGFVDFDSVLGGTYINRNFLTTTGTGNIIAPLWDDHNPAAANSDAVYYQTVDSDTFVVQWNSLLPFGNNQQVNLVTFQLILERSGAITYQYLQMNATANVYTYTIGMENVDGSQAVVASHRQTLQPEVNPNLAHPLMAIRFNPLAPWISVSESSVVVPANGSATVDLTFDSSETDLSFLTSEISFVYSDEEIGDVVLPISLTVSDEDAPVASNVGISGAAQAGEILTAGYTYSDTESSPEGATLIEWMEADAENGPYGVVASGNTYALQEADIGKWVKLRVTPISTEVPTNGDPVESAAVGPISGIPSFDGLPYRLVGYWPFDDAMDPTVDASGNGRHANLQSGTDFVYDGVYGDAIQVTGSGGAQAGTTHFMSNDFSIAAWVKHDGAYTTATNEIIFSKGWDFYLGMETVSSDGKLRIQIKHSGGSVSNAHLDNGKTVLAPDTWTHVGVVRDGASFTFYINGVETNPSWTGGATTNPIDSNATPLAIGYNALSGNTWWRGCIDDVQLYDRALHSSEMAAIYNRSPNVKLAWKTGVFASLPGGINHVDAADNANPDGDPFNNLLEFAFRLDPLSADPENSHIQQQRIDQSGIDYFGISYTRRRGVGSGSTENGYSIDGITYTVERSLDLSPDSWESGSALLLQTDLVDNLDGTETVTVRSRSAMTDQDSEFFSLEVAE